VEDEAGMEGREIADMDDIEQAWTTIMKAFASAEVTLCARANLRRPVPVR
jgi:hypothetical protein